MMIVTVFVISSILIMSIASYLIGRSDGEIKGMQETSELYDEHIKELRGIYENHIKEIEAVYKNESE